MEPGLEALLENTALRVAARQEGGAPLLAIAQHLPVPIESIHRALSRMVREGLLESTVQEGVRYYLVEQPNLGKTGCVSCDSPSTGSMCEACETRLSPGLLESARKPTYEAQVLAEHELMMQLAAANGEEIALSTLTRNAVATAQQLEPILQKMLGLQMVQLGQSFKGLSCIPPKFNYEQTLLDQHRARFDRARTQLNATSTTAKLKRRWRGITAALILGLLITGVVDYLMLRSARKLAANRYWNIFHNLRDQERLIAANAALLTQGDARRASKLKAEILSLKEMSVHYRMKRDKQLRASFKKAIANMEEHALLLEELRDFERRTSEQAKLYNLAAKEYRAQKRGVIAPIVAKLFYFRDLYRPLDESLWK